MVPRVAESTQPLRRRDESAERVPVSACCGVLIDVKSADDRDPIATEQRAAGDGLVELRLNLLRTAWALVGDLDNAEDLVHETLTAIMSTPTAVHDLIGTVSNSAAAAWFVA